MGNFRNGRRYFEFWIVLIGLVALVALTIAARDAAAYSQYSVNGGDATNCGSCHGDFRATSYTSLVDNQVWGNLHNIHRTNMLSGDCDTCHLASGTFPVELGASAGGTGLAAIGCMGCHGRNEDAGHDTTGFAGRGAGLRQHHYRKGATGCAVCHADANPASYTPVGEHVKPPYYANPGTGHASMPTDPCNHLGKENFAGALLGLDNDGDDLYDLADPDCRLARSDFDGDKRADFGVWRPSTGTWYIRRSSNGTMAARQWGLGSLGDNVVSGDFDGDYVEDFAVWRPSTGYWFILRSSDNVVVSQQWGLGSLNDVPVPADYDGDGKTDVAVWRPSSGNWYILRSLDNVMSALQWGLGSANDVPVPGDYDGDGKDDVAVWRADIGEWYIHRSSDNAVVSCAWGTASLGDVPVVADYDGDGKTDIAVWRPSSGQWFIQRSTVGVFDYNAYPGDRSPVQWGLSTDVPVPGDFDKDGKADIAVWRPSNGQWFVKRSSDGQMQASQWGVSTDVPIR